jgi:hypothetical protein
MDGNVWFSIINLVVVLLVLFLLRRLFRMRSSGTPNRPVDRTDDSDRALEALVASAFPELETHTRIISLLKAMGFSFARHSGFFPNSRPTDVQAIVSGTFQASDAATALSLLMSIKSGDTNAEEGRVRLAALRISGGDINQLEAAVTSAKRDYREVVQEAESMHKFVGSERPLAPGVTDRSVEVFREYVLWLLQYLQSDTYEICGSAGK